jgi:hypothetical protein
MIQIACLVFGIIILIKGRYKFSASKEVCGTPAYIVGVLLLAIFPTAFVTGVIIALIEEDDPAPNQQFIDPKVLLLDLGILIAYLLPALIISFVAAKPIERKRRFISRDNYDDYEREENANDNRNSRRRRRNREEEDDEDSADLDEENSPRRRRPPSRDTDDNDENDRPKRGRSYRNDDEDDHDERPRRRRRDDDYE